MDHESGPLEADDAFFRSLIEARPDDLDRLLADDFILIDVMGGSEVPRAALLEMIGSGRLAFEAIDPAERRVRRYGSTAVVTGRTRMGGRYEGTPFAASSRYTHVFVEQEGRWRLVAAQGTPIAP